jgi:zinc protease
LREEKGLAYEAWALFIPEYNYPGLFMAKAQTRIDKTFEVINLMKNEIRSVQQDITEEELAVAKEGILNSEVFWSDTKDKVITRLLRYEYYGYPFDYPGKLIEGIKKVTKQDIIRVANELLLPGEMTVLIVGNPEKFDAPLPPSTAIIPLTP